MCLFEYVLEYVIGQIDGTPPVTPQFKNPPVDMARCKWQIKRPFQPTELNAL